MIDFILGLPRNGKGILAARRGIRELTTTTRYLIGNFAWRLDYLQDYLDSKGYNIHVQDRVRVLTDDETREFWLYREDGYVMTKCPGYDDPKADTLLDYEPYLSDPRFHVGGVITTPPTLENKQGLPTPMRGVCYILDEIQGLWPSRKWAEVPRFMSRYFEQHGKLNDQCYLITQHSKQVPPAFARVAQSFTYCRNNRLRKFRGFAGGTGFTAKTYEQLLTNPREQIAVTIEDYPLDKKLANTYDTSAGVGMPGGGPADGGAKVKGFPVWMVWVGIAAISVGFYYAFTFGVRAVAEHWLPKSPKGQTHSKVVGTPAIPSQVTPALPPPSDLAPVTAQKQKSKFPPLAEMEPPKVWVQGIVNSPKGILVLLSDGRTLTNGDGVLAIRARNGVYTVDGTFIPLRRPHTEEKKGEPTLPASAGSRGGESAPEKAKEEKHEDKPTDSPNPSR